MKGDHSITIDRKFVDGTTYSETFSFLSYKVAMDYVEMCKAQPSCVAIKITKD